MPEAQSPDTALCTERLIQASPAAIFAAFANADLLAQWWGPDGFSNTFDAFDFQPGGRWVFTMHGPDGKDYANEAVFTDIVAGERVVIEHVVPPWFLLTVTLQADGDGTRLTWIQAFETAAMAAKLAPVCRPSNEQVLDRLQRIVESRDR